VLYLLEYDELDIRKEKLNEQGIMQQYEKEMRIITDFITALQLWSIQ
jgi:hypothetical protein